jgi:predicted kinase
MSTVTTNVPQGQPQAQQPRDMHSRRPKMLILRGPTGAGKTTYVSLKLGPRVIVFSADKFFTDTGGVYRFDPTRIGDAHAWCYRQVLKAAPLVYEEDTLLVIDNTNISAWEIAPYVALANAYGLDWEILTFWVDPLVAARRNVHGVPASAVMEMHRRLLTESLPWKQTVILPEDDVAADLSGLQ